jgi:hypothetical protein
MARSPRLRCQRRVDVLCLRENYVLRLREGVDGPGALEGPDPQASSITSQVSSSFAVCASIAEAEQYLS